MHVTGSADQLVKPLSQLHNPFIQLNQISLCLNRALLIPEHKAIISQRLDFQIIIKMNQPGKLRVRNPSQKGLVKLPSLTSRANNETFPVLLQQALWNTGPSGIVGKMGPADQTVQINTPYIIFSQNNHMVGRHFHDCSRIHSAQSIKLIQILHVPLPQQLYKSGKYLCSSLRVIYCPVMIFQRNV